MTNDDRRSELVMLWLRKMEVPAGSSPKHVALDAVRFADAVLAAMEATKPKCESVEATLQVAQKDHDELLKRLARRGDTNTTETDATFVTHAKSAVLTQLVEDAPKPPPATDTLAVLTKLRKEILSDYIDRAVDHIDRAIREAEGGEDLKGTHETSEQ